MDSRRITNAAGWPPKRASIARVEVIVARRKDKLPGCYKSTKGKTRSRKSNFGSTRFSPLVTENEWVGVRPYRTTGKVFQTGFGREHLSKEIREMLLYGQLQEGLSYSLMESPAVSGAQNYKELCLAAKREERRLAELKKKQQ